MEAYQLYVCPGCEVAFVRIQSILDRGKKAEGWIGPEQAFLWKYCKACDAELEAKREESAQDAIMVAAMKMAQTTVQPIIDREAANERRPGTF